MADLTESERRMLRQIHYPVTWTIGEFNHDDAQRLRKRAMADGPGAPDLGAVLIIEAALPEHVEDSRYPRWCALECHVEVETATCAQCGLWMDEDGELNGTPWPCPTARVLQLDLHVPPCTCRWAIRSRGLHDSDCAYLAATHSVGQPTQVPEGSS